MTIVKRIKNSSTALRIAVLAGCVAVLAACHGTEIDNARGLAPTSSDFNNRLYPGYLRLSEYELAEYDYRDSDGFAIKAIAAADDGSVMPANLDEWRIPEDHVDELSKARARLMNALDANGRNKIPDTAAHAQVMFDCWVEEQEEDIQPGHIAACRNAFYNAIGVVEVALRPPQVVQVAPASDSAPAPEAQLEPEAEPEAAPEAAPSLATYYVVFFDFDSAELSNAAKQTLDEAAAATREMRPYKILIYGHTDRAGPEWYNDVLGERRARAVANHMIEQGAGRFLIDIESFGESRPIAKTNDNVRDGRNRRTEVTLTGVE